MKIRKFNEADDINDISSDRTNEIIEDLRKTIVFLEQKVENIDSYLNELGNFQNTEKSKNDQIDDAVSNLQLVRSALKDSITNLDNSTISLEDYNKSGRKYLY
jgi:hypothetical protein